MDLYISPQMIEKSRDRVRKNKCLLWIMGTGMLGLFVLLCLLTRTGNARTMLLIAMGSMTLTGWGILAFWLFAAEPAKAEASHLAGLREVEGEIREGVLKLDPEGFRIPKSIRVLKVYLETDKGTLSLNLNEKLRAKVPPDGSRVRVKTARKFIVGMEILKKAAGDTPRAVPSVWKKTRRNAGRFFPGAVIWIMLAILLTGFVFARITDTDPSRKITVFADCKIRDAADLAEKLEKGMEGSVRMVKVHPFSYAMLDSAQIKNADLYIVPDSKKEEFAEWFREEYAVVADPGNADAVCGEYFLYEEGASVYRLYIGAASPHLEDGLARKAAELLISME